VRTHPGLLVAPAGVAGCVAAIAIGGTPPLGAVAWLGAGVALALSMRSAPHAAGSPVDDLERHVMRCRRRGESAHVLVAHVPATGHGQAERLTAFFRLTDSVLVAQIPHGYEVAGVFDDSDLDRNALEKRLRTAAATPGTTIAWKRFPDDGVTLPVLIDATRAALAGSAAIEAAAIVPPVFDGAPATTPVEGK
jgi:hypothetical protein